MRDPQPRLVEVVRLDDGATIVIAVPASGGAAAAVHAHLTAGARAYETNLGGVVGEVRTDGAHHWHRVRGLTDGELKQLDRLIERDRRPSPRTSPRDPDTLLPAALPGILAAASTLVAVAVASATPNGPRIAFLLAWTGGLAWIAFGAAVVVRRRIARHGGRPGPGAAFGARTVVVTLIGVVLLVLGVLMLESSATSETGPTRGGPAIGALLFQLGTCLVAWFAVAVRLAWRRRTWRRRYPGLD